MKRGRLDGSWRANPGATNPAARSVAIAMGFIVPVSYDLRPSYSPPPAPYPKCAFKNLPVCDALQRAIASGVPVATTSPPACPPSGPRSIT